MLVWTPILKWVSFLGHLCFSTFTKAVVYRMRPPTDQVTSSHFHICSAGVAEVAGSDAHGPWHHIRPFIGFLCNLSLILLFSSVTVGWLLICLSWRVRVPPASQIA